MLERKTEKRKVPNEAERYGNKSKKHWLRLILGKKKRKLSFKIWRKKISVPI